MARELCAYCGHTRSEHDRYPNEPKGWMGCRGRRATGCVCSGFQVCEECRVCGGDGYLTNQSFCHYCNGGGKVMRREVR